MLNYIKDNFAKIFAVVGTVSAVLGMYINNIYLSKYGIYDFYVANIKIIYSGFFFIFYFVVFTLIFFINMDIANPKNNTVVTVFGNFLFKSLLCTNYVFYIIYISNMENLKTISNTNILELFVMPCTFFNMYTYLMLMLNSRGILTNHLFESLYCHDGQVDKKLIVLLKRLANLLKGIIYITTIITPFAYFHITAYRRLCLMFVGYFFSLFIACIIFFAQEDSKAIFAIVGSPFNNKGLDKNNIRAFEKTLIKILLIMMSIYLIMNNTSIYGTEIFPYIEPKYGGARPIAISVMTKDAQIDGRLIYQNNDFFYLAEFGKDNIRIMKIGDIISYKKINASCNEE